MNTLNPQLLKDSSRQRPTHYSGFYIVSLPFILWFTLCGILEAGMNGPYFVNRDI